MPEFGPASRAQLATIHPDLQKVLQAVVARWDCTILEGKRSLAQQQQNVAKGVSKTIESKHLAAYSENPTLGVDAVDVAPFPLKWPEQSAQWKQLVATLTPAQLALVGAFAKDLARWYYFAGYVLGTGDQMGIPLRHGGDWNGNREIDDQAFDDLPHIERKR